MRSIDFTTLLCQTLIFLLLLLERITSGGLCIVNNGNILTDGRWKCHYQQDKRMCWRE